MQSCTEKLLLISRNLPNCSQLACFAAPFLSSARLARIPRPTSTFRNSPANWNENLGIGLKVFREEQPGWRSKVDLSNQASSARLPCANSVPAARTLSTKCANSRKRRINDKAHSVHLRTCHCWSSFSPPLRQQGSERMGNTQEHNLRDVWNATSGQSKNRCPRAYAGANPHLSSEQADSNAVPEALSKAVRCCKDTPKRSAAVAGD